MDFFLIWIDGEGARLGNGGVPWPQRKTVHGFDGDGEDAQGVQRNTVIVIYVDGEARGDWGKEDRGAVGII